MRLAVLALIGVGCGRIGFDPAGGAAGDGNLADVTTACVSDGFCAPACGETDPDCQTTCGDGTCVGNAGELCTTCTADCKTTANVCGNGTCGPGEDGTTCYSDCGPVPWTWAQDEADLFTAINQARTGGTTCPGGTGTLTAPALVMDPALRAAARDFVWESAHLGTSSLNRCDGQGVFAWASSTGATNFNFESAPTTTAGRVATLLGSQGTCTTVMDPSLTAVGIAIAIDQSSMLGLLFR